MRMFQVCVCGQPLQCNESPTPRPAGTEVLLKSATDQPKKRPKENAMAKDKFIIEPHFRLQEWVAEEKGYFKDEGPGVASSHRPASFETPCCA